VVLFVDQVVVVDLVVNELVFRDVDVLLFVDQVVVVDLVVNELVLLDVEVA
jgi:hypothetical protein